MPFRPEEVLFSPTLECNLACAHCSTAAPRSITVLSEKLARRFLKRIYSATKVIQMTTIKTPYKCPYCRSELLAYSQHFKDDEFFYCNCHKYNAKEGTRFFSWRRLWGEISQKIIWEYLKSPDPKKLGNWVIPDKTPFSKTSFVFY